MRAALTGCCADDEKISGKHHDEEQGGADDVDWVGEILIELEEVADQVGIDCRRHDAEQDKHQCVELIETE